MGNKGLPFVIKICLATIGVAFYVRQLRLAHFFICGINRCSFEEGAKKKTYHDMLVYHRASELRLGTY